MSRSAREKSKSGIYHIMLRGINRQDIFCDDDDEDNVRFLETLERYKAKSKLKIYGWCLMSNHIHLLLGEGQEELSKTIKRIAVSYAWFYNNKYNTVGHVFQDRYKSENVENDAYLMTVIRYIHHNPVKAGIANRPDEWKWSSCRGYYGLLYYPAKLLDESNILDMLSEDKERARELLKAFHEEANSDRCLDETNKVRLTDHAARMEIARLIAGHPVEEIKSLPKAQKDEVLRKIKEIEGISLRQAARILGISHVQIHMA